jgi:hypothetical protein
MPRVRPFSLPIVDPGDQLRGVAPAVLERAARLCKSGDATHRGIVATAAAIAGHALATTVPPGAAEPIVAALEVAHGWVRDELDEGRVRKARSDGFAAITALETRTVAAVRASLGRFERKPSPIDAHADGVVVRYAGLGAYYAAGAALFVLDAIGTPSHAIGVGQQAAGALAYHRTGLGPARSSELRARAWEQAAFEVERAGAPAGHGQGELAVQLFHEFLGAAWKDSSDAGRVYFGDFTEWALAGSANGV